MPGYVVYDFGDAIRTTVNTAAEDDKDLKKITVNMELLQSFTQGFLQEIKSFLTETEMESLALGILLLLYIIGLRLLTDYIAGDHYYKIHFPAHNPQRSRAQLQLVRKLEEQYAQIEEIIRANDQAEPALSCSNK